MNEVLIASDLFAACENVLEMEVVVRLLSKKSPDKADAWRSTANIAAEHKGWQHRWCVLPKKSISARPKSLEPDSG